MINTSATQLPMIGGGAGGAVQLLLNKNTSIANGMPGSSYVPYQQPQPSSQPPAGNSTPSTQSSSASQGSFWSDWFELQLNTPVSGPPTPEASLKLARDLILQGDPLSAPFLLSNQTLPLPELDMAAVQGVFVLPSESGAQANHSTSNTSTPVTLTFSNLTLVNLPPGPPSTYPLGMSTLMMWSVDMDR
jgi:hypothetical protein